MVVACRSTVVARLSSPFTCGAGGAGSRERAFGRRSRERRDRAQKRGLVALFHLSLRDFAFFGAGSRVARGGKRDGRELRRVVHLGARPVAVLGCCASRWSAFG